MNKYINRDALLEKMGKRHYHLLKNHGVWDPYAYGFDSAIGMVSAEPASDVAEVRHGEWAGGMFDDVWTCKECSYEHAMYVLGKLSATNYCPNCGAKMDGGNE